jgi:hypothetical protein
VFRHGNGEAEAAGFEAAGRVCSLFFDVEAGVALAVEHRGPAFAERDGGYVGEDVRIAPHAQAGCGCCGFLRGGFTLGGLLELVHVVTDVEGAGAEGAEGLRGVGGDVVVAARALEVGDGGHGSIVLKRWALSVGRGLRWRSGFLRCAVRKSANRSGRNDNFEADLQRRRKRQQQILRDDSQEQATATAGTVATPSTGCSKVPTTVVSGAGASGVRRSLLLCWPLTG